MFFSSDTLAVAPGLRGSPVCGLAVCGPSLFFAEKRARHISVDLNLGSYRKCLALFCRRQPASPQTARHNGDPTHSRLTRLAKRIATKSAQTVYSSLNPCYSFRRMKFKFLETIWEAGGEIFEVGGSVRDKLLGLPRKDIDLLVRNLSFEKLKGLLQPLGKIALVGKSFGVLKFTPHQAPDQIIDIALPRKEQSTGVGHRDFEISFDPELSVETDLGRRDFTLNAMALNLKTEQLIDPFNGATDLKNKLLRQVFPKAFEEDPLRLIRAVQFAARLGLTIESATWEQMKQHAALIQTVSPERITEELRKLFLAPQPSLGFDLMLTSGLLPFLFPELVDLVGISQDKLPGDDVYRHTMRVLDAARADTLLEHPGDLELMISALFHDTGKAATQQFDPKKERIVFYSHQVVSARLARRWMKRMHVTTLGVNPDNINTMIFNHMFETKSYYTDKAIRRFVQKIGQDLIYKLLDLRLADNRGGKHPRSVQGVLKMRARVQEELAKKPPFGPGDLALTGNDLKTMGFHEGPNIGKVLKALVEKVLEDPVWNTQEQLATIVKEMMQNDPTLLEKKR